MRSEKGTVTYFVLGTLSLFSALWCCSIHAYEISRDEFKNEYVKGVVVVKLVTSEAASGPKKTVS